MRLLMLSNVDILNKSSIGVMNKMFGQAKAFKSYGIDVNFIYNKSHIVILDKLYNNEKIKIRPSSTKDYYNKILKLIKINNYDAVYIRYTISEYFFLNFLNSLKKVNDKIKILIDFPTYPYQLEIKDKHLLIIDNFFVKYLVNYIDFGVCYNELNNIYDIPVYSIGNGISLESISIKNKVIETNNRIDLIAVANVAFWQGYDRLIEGLKNYYSGSFNYLVYFNIVGLGSDIVKLVNLVNEYNLQEYVIFHGYKSGEDLDELFDNCDIGISTLGMYRKGIEDGTTLKVREYCARGIPFVLGYDDLDFQSNFKYVHKVTNDDTPIDINAIVEFYNRVHNDKKLAADMHKYAEYNLAWEAKLRPIVEKILR